MKKLIKAISAVAVISLLAAPAMAATEWNFGGSLQYKTFWTERDYGKYSGEDLQGGGASLKNDGILDWSTQGDTNISMEMVSDHLTGYIELEYDFDENKVKTKKYWGQYNFTNNFNILIGQTDPLFIQEISRQVAYDNMNLNGLGTSNSDTLPMIALGYKGFTFALAKPVSKAESFLEANNRGFGLLPQGPFEATYDLDTFMPQLQASYAYEADTWRIKLAGAYANTRIKKFSYYDTSTLATYDFRGSKTIHSWLFGIDGQVFFGPLSLGGAVSFGQNWETAGWNEFELNLGHALINPNPATMTSPRVSYKVKDSNTLMLAVTGGYQLTERLYFEAGAGYRRDDNDMFEDANQSWTVYLQAAYEVAPGFSIIPEVGYIDYGDNTGFKWAGTRAHDTKSQGYEWYAGAQWRMDF